MIDLRAAAAPGLRAAREHKYEFMGLVALAWVMAFVYYMVPAVTAWADHASAVKTRNGIWFAAAATAVGCVLIPEVAKKLGGKRRSAWRDIPFLLVFWAGVGIFVDLSYTLMARVIGSGTDPATVTQKVLVDQFVFCPLITMPYGVVMFAWKDAGYSVAGAGRMLRNGEFWRRWSSTLAMCWAFWIPTVVAIFALPGDVKFLMFLVMEGTWSLLLLHVLSADSSQNSEVSSHNTEPEAGVA